MQKFGLQKKLLEDKEKCSDVWKLGEELLKTMD